MTLIGTFGGDVLSPLSSSIDETIKQNDAYDTALSSSFSARFTADEAPTTF